MRFSYKFYNLLGNVYKKGNLLFTPDGNSVISPVGNRITIFDLKNNKTTTLPIESRYNYRALDLSPNGCILFAVNEEGEGHLISLISQTIIHRYLFKGKVRAVKFSPNNKYVAVCKETNVFVFKIPGVYSGEYNVFIMERVFHGAYNDTTCLDWTTDSKILAVGSKDMDTKLYPLEKWSNFQAYSLGNHTDGIVGCFFEENSYDITTISRNGQTCIWECTINPSDLIPQEVIQVKKKKISNDMVEDDIDDLKTIEATADDITGAIANVSVDEEKRTNQKSKTMYYKRIVRHYLADEAKKENRNAFLTAAAYHKKTKILITGFSTGSFFIHELPDVNLIHSLNISEQHITAITLNLTGDWIALGCSGLGQLLVWEWQSETYVMKQQGHSNNVSCVSYSTDGQVIATGAEDGKLKLWNIYSSFCFITFTEHSSAITGVAFGGNKKFVVSASLDGTVRAYDIIRYRNFKTFTSTRPVQFSCVSIDSSGEIVAAGGQDCFEIHLWSVKTGKLLEVLNGHEGPISSLTFSPLLTRSVLVSVSWDKTLKIWDAIEKGSSHETIELISDGICVAFRPDGEEVAVATLDGQISFFDLKTSIQISTIEGRNDLASGRLETDLITAKKTLQAKCFTTLCYSADGEYILAGGQSKNICIYNIKESLLLKKFEITQNRSLDGVDDFINRRKLTEFGNMALIEERNEITEEGSVNIKLPGVKKGDMSSRSCKPEVRVFSVQFSPTGQQWAAATTEGLLIYSLQAGLVFDPWNLQMEITPKLIRESLDDHTNALIMAIKLNEGKLIKEVIERVPVKDIELVVSNLEEVFVKRLLLIIAGCTENSRHLEFYLCWIQQILSLHGPRISGQKDLPILLAVEKSLIRKCEQISKICNYNKYTLRFVANLADKTTKLKQDKMETDSDEDRDSNIGNVEESLLSD